MSDHNRNILSVAQGSDEDGEKQFTGESINFAFEAGTLTAVIGHGSCPWSRSHNARVGTLGRCEGEFSENHFTERQRRGMDRANHGS